MPGAADGTKVGLATLPHKNKLTLMLCAFTLWEAVFCCGALCILPHTRVGQAPVLHVNPLPEQKIVPLRL